MYGCLFLYLFKKRCALLVSHPELNHLFFQMKYIKQKVFENCLDDFVVRILFILELTIISESKCYCTYNVMFTGDEQSFVNLSRHVKYFMLFY